MTCLLIVGRWSSRCGACGLGADPHETHHRTVLSYSESLRGKPGCGAEFTAVSSEYGPEDDEATQNLRPDLPLVADLEPDQEAMR